MSLIDMLRSMRLTEYLDCYMNVAAAIDLYLALRNDGFADDLTTIANYYRIDPNFIHVYLDGTGPFIDEAYLKLIEIIRARHKYDNARLFCLHSTYWIGCEHEAGEMLDKFKTLVIPDVGFVRTRHLWRKRTWRDLWFNLFD